MEDSKDSAEAARKMMELCVAKDSKTAKAPAAMSPTIKTGRKEAGDVLRDHPGYTLLESEEVKRLGVRARPLQPETPLKPGRLYFLVELPRWPDLRVPRRAWSGALHVTAKERLESLVLSRRSVSGLTAAKPSSVEPVTDGTVRLRVRLPKAQVAKLMEDSKDSAEAARKMMELCVAKDSKTAKAPAAMSPTIKTGRKEAVEILQHFGDGQDWKPGPRSS
ncbi:hypothetical protein COCNU_scaffold046327G000010 [Cocos nucifera]|nr:hypothetical protein [Cocos nucifera]